jgi:AI-2 transport protein TqsA
MKTISSDSASRFFIAVIGIVVIAITLRELSHIFIPFVIAFFLFFVFNPLNLFLEKNKIPLSLITLIDLFITIAVLYVVSKVVVDSFLGFADSLPEYVEKLSLVVRETALSAGISDPYFADFTFESIIEKINYSNLAGGVFSSTISLFGSILFVIFFFVFVLFGEKGVYETIKKRYVISKIKPEIKKIKKKLVDEVDTSENDSAIEHQLKIEKEEREKKLENTFKAITDQIQKYIITKILVNAGAGVLVGFGLYLFGVDYPVVWGLFTFLFNFIPTIGSAFALILPVLFTILQFDSLGITIGVILFMITVQTVSFNLVEPIIMGRRLNLNPLVILLSVLIWGWIWGIIGMLMSVPLTAVINIIFTNSDSKNLNFISELMSTGEK